MKQIFAALKALVFGATSVAPLIALPHTPSPGPTTANSQAKVGTTGSRSDPSTDGQFLRQAVMLNMTALEAGHNAQFQCDDTELHRLAEQLVIVLGRIDSEMRQMAKRSAIPVAEQLDHAHRARLAMLERLHGAAFAQMYLHRFAIEAPLELIRLCGMELANGSDESLRVAAGKWLQDLRNALTLARGVYFASAQR